MGKNSSEKKDLVTLGLGVLAAAGALGLKLADFSPQVESVSSNTKEEAMGIVQDIGATQNTAVTGAAGSGVAIETKLADLQK